MEIQDNVAFLKEAKAELIHLKELKDTRTKMDVEGKRLEKALKEENKAMNDAIKSTIKSRQDELVSSYESEINKLNDKIKKENNRRDKAVAQGKKVRKKQETESLRQENSQLAAKMKEMFRQDGVPAFCNTKAYYALFQAKSMKEMGVMILTAIIFFLAIPYLIYYLSAASGVLALVLIYIGCIIVFGGIYIMINEKTKMSHPEAIKKGRDVRDKIAANKKEIRKIEDGIEKDSDESFYQLEEYDTNLAELNGQLENITLQKKDAMDNFENVTKQDITQEIQNNHMEKITSMETTLEQVRRDFKIADDDSRELGLAFSQNYGTYIDKAFLQEEKLDRLIELIESGEATNITEAQNICKIK